MKQLSDFTISARLWITTVIVLTLIVYCMTSGFFGEFVYVFYFFIAALVGSLPALLAYVIVLPFIEAMDAGIGRKTVAVYRCSLIIIILYCILVFFVIGDTSLYGLLNIIKTAFFPLLIAISASIAINWKGLRSYYLTDNITDSNISDPLNQINPNMESYVPNETGTAEEPLQNNKPLTKGLVTAGLILLMLIPTLFISNLVRERQVLQAVVVNDVASKWALAQTITGPYLYVPYHYQEKEADGKIKTYTKHLLILPDELAVNGDIIPEERQRSIYKVLLYKTSLNNKGKFNLQLPKEVDPASVMLNDIKLCVGISDFKGIEKKVSITINGKTYDLMPGLPVNDIDSSGLSANIDLSAQQFGDTLSFDMPLQIRGSRQLHFAPLSGNSQFTLRSTWPSPSFDGTTLPSVREVSDGGFSATWTFSKANLPFNTVLQDAKIDKRAVSFGVSMLQPADQYAKTERSVKYALLIIGLTFSLFFIIELMQKRPVHPVQYLLVGLALIIFYTLLLSISEFILFDNAYLIAATATVALITLYTKSHFKKWKTAGIFGITIAGLYSFIFVLIRLEDTALLLGSIGLFIILSAVMYASRKINWYSTPQHAA